MNVKLELVSWTFMRDQLYLFSIEIPREFNKKELSNNHIVYFRDQESWLKTWKFLIPQRGQDLS
jgi:hypothetical protein